MPEISEKIWQRIIINNNDHIKSSKNFFDFPIDKFRRDEQDILLSYDYPGNVRQLEGLLNRVFLLWQNASFKRSRLEILETEIEVEKNRWAKSQYMEMPNFNNHNYLRLFNLMIKEGRSFWEIVHKSYIKHEISREDLKKIIRLGLEKSGWSFKSLLPLFNIKEEEYKKFLNFLYSQRIKIRELTKL